jgi:hypothetical protein
MVTPRPFLIYKKARYLVGVQYLFEEVLFYLLDFYQIPFLEVVTNCFP